MRTMFRIVLLVLCFQLVGCASRLKSNQVRVTYHSDPPGAMLSDNLTNWGMAPQTRIIAGDPSEGVVRAEVTAVWPSGARETHSSVMKFGREARVTTIRRSNEPPGLDRDMEFAGQLKRNTEEKRREESQNEEKRQENADGLFLGVLSGVVQVINARNEVPPRPAVSSAETNETLRSIMSDEKKKSSSATPQDYGYQTRDHSGILVDSRSCYQTKDAFGILVMSAGCSK